MRSCLPRLICPDKSLLRGKPFPAFRDTESAARDYLLDKNQSVEGALGFLSRQTGECHGKLTVRLRPFSLRRFTCCFILRGMTDETLKKNIQTSDLGAANKVDLLLLGMFWCLCLIIIHPLGNFPLHDDWSFGMAAKGLAETGDFRPCGWVSMPLIVNALWGALFCLPFGFSFTALRFSSLVLGLFGVLGSYLLARELRLGRRTALVIAIVTGFNPLYFSQANTFMTDVPFATIMLFSALFFARTLRTGSVLDWLAGIMLALAATLSRQLGLAVPLAFGIILLWRDGLTLRSLTRVIIPIAICAGALFLFEHWLKVSGRLPALYNAKSVAMLNVLKTPKIFAGFLASNIYVSLVTIGWFLLPVILAAAVAGRRRFNVRTAVICAITVAALAVGIEIRSKLGLGHLMPVARDVLDNAGIGPITVRDVCFLRINRPPAPPTAFWFGITALSLLGAAFLLVATVKGFVSLIQQSRNETNDPGRCSFWKTLRLPVQKDVQAAGCVFVLLSAAAYMTPLLAIPESFYDRYIIVTIPLVAIGVAILLERRRNGEPLHADAFSAGPINVFRIALGVMAVCLMIIAVFSVGATRDYLVWNQIRWNALMDLMKQGVKAEQIDGGFEFNGLYLYDPKYRKVPEKSMWWVQGDEYLIAFGKTPGYHVIKEFRYSHCMPPGIGKVLVLRKDAQAGNTSL